VEDEKTLLSTLDKLASAQAEVAET